MTQEIENEIQEKGLEAPRVTYPQIKALVDKLEFEFVRTGEAGTICSAYLGTFRVAQGYSAAVSVENFDPEIGEKIAKENCLKSSEDALWSNMGFTLFKELNPEIFGLPSKQEKIAQVCHGANRAICEAFGDNSQKTWDEAEEWQRESAIKGVDFAINNPNAPASHQHDAWSQDKLDNGWVYGDVKDPEKKTHPCLINFEDLPPNQQAKDLVFKAIVKEIIA